MSELELTVKPDLDTTSIEKGLTENRKVDEAEVEKSLNYDALSDAEKQAIDVFLSKLDILGTYRNPNENYWWKN